MPTITRKKIKGKPYYYAVQSAWVDGKSRIVWQKYLGTAEAIMKAVTEKNVPYTAKVLDFGALAVLYKLAGELDLAGIIDRHVSKRDQGVSVGQYMLIAALNRAVAPTSKRQIGNWFENTSLCRWLPIKSKQLSSQRFWDHMGYLDEKIISAIELELTQKMVEKFNLDLKTVLYDATNFCTYIDTATESELPQRGNSKAKRGDLKQVSLALLATYDFHIPLFHAVYPGNRPDSKEFGYVVKDLIERYRILARESVDITFIFDKGNNSKDNFKEFVGTVKFVGSLSPSHHGELLEVPFEEFVPLSIGGVNAYRTAKKVFGAERTVIVTYNESLYLGQMQGLIKQLRRAQGSLRELKKQLEEQSRRKKGKKINRTSALQKIAGILSPPLSKMISYELKGEDVELSLSYHFDHLAQEAYTRVHFGKNILFTNQHDWSTEEIVTAYRGQARIEDAFKLMKDAHFIGWSPMFHWTDQKIAVHGFYCVLALTLLSLLARELQSKGFDVSKETALKELARVYEVAHIYSPESKQKNVFTLSERSELQQKLLNAFGLTELHMNG